MEISGKKNHNCFEKAREKSYKGAKELLCGVRNQGKKPFAATITFINSILLLLSLAHFFSLLLRNPIA